MKKISKILLVLFNILISLYLLFTIVMLQGPTPLFVLGILYILMIKSIIKSTFPKRLLLYGILPFSLLSSLMLFLGADPKIPPGFRMEILHAIVGTIIIFGIFSCNYVALKFFSLKTKKNITRQSS